MRELFLRSSSVLGIGEIVGAGLTGAQRAKVFERVGSKPSSSNFEGFGTPALHRCLD